MPRGTKVDVLYRKLLSEGRSKESAARIAQSATGLSLETGEAPTMHVTDKWKLKIPKK